MRSDDDRARERSKTELSGAAAVVHVVNCAARGTDELPTWPKLSLAPSRGEMQDEESEAGEEEAGILLDGHHPRTVKEKERAREG